MKMLVSVAAAALLVAAAGAAQAGDFYAQADVGFVARGSTELSASGVGSADADTEMGFLIDGLVGYQIDGGFAVEGELLFTENGIDAGALGTGNAEVSTELVMANGKYTFNSDKDWAPYVGAGVGYGRVNYEFFGLEDSDKGVAWQLKAGVLIKGGEHTMDIGYRYLRAPEYKVSDGVDTVTAETGVHALTIGIRF